MVRLVDGLPGDAGRFARLIALLRCPGCREGLRYEAVPQREPGLGVFGLLHCACRTRPVIDSIPVLIDQALGAYGATAEPLVTGPTPDVLVEMIREGRGREALVECLAVPYIPGANSWNERAGALERRLDATLRRHLSRPGLGKAIRRRQLARLLERPADSVTAVELIRHFYGPGSPLPAGYGYYYLYRFCLPRWLAGMSLMATIPPTKRPILDIACGFGHSAHFLQGQGIADLVVGGDITFVAMWAARRTSARNACFVVLDANAPLPFADDAFGAAMIADAFMYIPNKPDLVAEMKRVAGDHPLLVLRCDVRGARPDLPNVWSPAEYAGFINAPGRTWVFGEERLVSDYLRQRTPDFDDREPLEALEYEHHVNLVVLPEGAAPLVPRRLDPWPHATGHLQLNPIYTPHPRRDGSVMLEAWFENTHFALQNARTVAYMPRLIRIDPGTLAALRAGRRTPEIEELIRTFVILGLPEHYADDPLGVATAAA